MCLLPWPFVTIIIHILLHANSIIIYYDGNQATRASRYFVLRLFALTDCYIYIYIYIHIIYIYMAYSALICPAGKEEHTMTHCWCLLHFLFFYLFHGNLV